MRVCTLAAVITLYAGTAAWAAVDEQRHFLDTYCVTCHNEKLRTANLALDHVDVSDVSTSAAALEKVVTKLRGGLMPPPGRPRPAEMQRRAFVTWLQSALDTAAAAHPNAGRTETFHRLNRAEYQNAVRDLLAVDVDVSQLLPADDASYGFDNMAGVLQLNQALLERYLSAAVKVSRIALGSALPSPVVDEFRVPSELPQYQHIDGLPLGTRGGLVIPYAFPQDGQYVFTIRLTCGPPNAVAVCDGAAGFADPHRLEISIDDERAGLFGLPVLPNGTLTEGGWSLRLPVKAGPHRVSVAFLAPPAIEEIEGYRLRFQKPYYPSVAVTEQSLTAYQPAISSVTIGGPFDSTGPGDTLSRRRILQCAPTPGGDEACAARVLGTLARRAYRRPVTATDLRPLMAFYRDGAREGGFEAGVALALQRLLVSPQFLFRIERDPVDARPGQNYVLGDLELASRLSFFLWSSVPDNELLGLAVRGELHDRRVLERQTRRMLADPKAHALVTNFAGQWLQLRNIDAKAPADPLFPDFDEGLRRAFRQETELFFESMIREDRSVMDLLNANYTFVNERLALHYGIPNVSGSHFRRVTLADDSPRRGLLGQGSILLITSHAVRTSPVLRGKWILNTLLGTPPPDPPANVPALPERDLTVKAYVVSVREKMAQHRANPVCASCHSMIDPLGFALENFDAIGKYRTLDENFEPIDASGSLPDGTKYNGLVQFRALLVSQPERFVNTVTERLLTYALGRGIEYYDKPAVRKITAEAARDGNRFSSIILGLVTSAPFTMRRAEALPVAFGTTAHLETGVH
jgi:hypothetical protein